MKEIGTHVVFIANPAIEFINAISFIANEEVTLKRFSELSFFPGEDFKLMVEEIRGKLSHFIYGELLHFFSGDDMVIVMISIIMENAAAQSVPAFLELMGHISDEHLLSYIICETLYNGNSSALPQGEQLAAPRLKQLIKDAEGKPDKAKEMLIECVDNTSEVKARLVFLLAQFYEKAYKPWEDKLLSQLSAAKNRYEDLFHKDPVCFNNEYLGKMLDAGFRDVIVHISYFTQIRAFVFVLKPHNESQLINLGIYTEEYPRKVFIRSKVKKFIKILSDNKRFEMIELLSKRPYYVNELSTELELTSPTVCYHLNSMLELNLVSLDKGNNRTFYSLNKKVIKELLDNASEILLENE